MNRYEPTGEVGGEAGLAAYTAVTDLSEPANSVSRDIPGPRRLHRGLSPFGIVGCRSEALGWSAPRRGCGGGSRSGSSNSSRYAVMYLLSQQAGKVVELFLERGAPEAIIFEVRSDVLMQVRARGCTAGNGRARSADRRAAPGCGDRGKSSAATLCDQRQSRRPRTRP